MTIILEHKGLCRSSYCLTLRGWQKVYGATLACGIPDVLYHWAPREGVRSSEVLDANRYYYTKDWGLSFLAFMLSRAQ